MKKKRHFKIRYIIFGFLIVVLFSSIVFMYFGGFSTGEVANIDEFKECAQPVENLSIPKDKKIIALGEATHGNSEFQQLKLDVFKKMVEDYDVRAFALEGDYGGCEQVAGYDICWLDFAKVPENSELGRQISEYTYMGNLGESYSIIMRILPPSYRIFQPPAVLYDSMIFVSEAVPTKIVSEE